MTGDPLASITPIVLTRDEELNISRCLGSLGWARRVVVLDSGSRDATREIALGHPNVAWFERAFDSFQGQWLHACLRTGVDTEYVLMLDADMTTPPELVAELGRAAEQRVDGGLLAFEYCYHGERLKGSVYPPQLRFFRPGEVRIEQRGHCPEPTIPGRVMTFQAKLIHDDRKPLERWVSAQLRYSREEADRISREPPRRARDILRRTGLAPLAVGAIAWVRAGGPLGGRLALRYAWERAVFEGLLAIRLLTPGGEAEDHRQGRS